MMNMLCTALLACKPCDLCIATGVLAGMLSCGPRAVPASKHPSTSGTALLVAVAAMHLARVEAAPVAAHATGVPFESLLRHLQVSNVRLIRVLSSCGKLAGYFQHASLISNAPPAVECCLEHHFAQHGVRRIILS